MKTADARLGAVFFLSGAAAIVYQIVWQRTLFTLFGSNMESVTLVVSAFLLGLGAGSALGGALSRRDVRTLPWIFALLEVGIGAYGLASLALFRWAAERTSSADGLAIGLIAGGLLLLPTLGMGATLPVLVAYRARRTGQVGRSVSALYALNTLGSAAGAALAAWALLGALGQAGSLRAAAAATGLVAALVVAGSRGKEGA